MQDDSALEFPCEFPIKAMGRAADNFDAVVVGIIRKHTPDFSDSTVKSRLSKSGNYVSITVTINARSREQLDNIYLDLTANDLVLVAL
ncbi:MAG: DUF493 domain-containing protein [Gammaproteobacteria bacterium]|nr:DUF493 family protein [Gammaproteobacteria bacterium]NIN61837.1 DUF493 family protein [Gammaproteobacteria bacterium]NIO63580.1 DUF493 family protein [Gammaproteobacteria bacterium]NIP49381.1 DUF493 domain-containing protein [Gammaproteobacteria bacterium]NIQ10605.1 DUF493 domain-containing protein [Gammaproteobacteria bacterium]